MVRLPRPRVRPRAPTAPAGARAPAPVTAGLAALAAGLAALAATAPAPPALAQDAPAGATTAAAPRGDYTGSEACGACHAAALAVWKASAHARAGDRISGVRGGAARRCQGCHTTGDAPASPPALAEVGCEACHGAGAHYAEDDIMRDLTLARALGLRDLSTPALRAAACDGCHFESTRLAPFDPEAAYRRIAH